ncbi:hypothetical protein F5J12DRAFT_785841 [Pisolithus orientalis]|uniref:uncharacterized protein n=1 Tax=Pisolithus orientalis TaxID=936130 RepID=UPI0022244153|nr:uncharacterized protein F5J12DRAFT_785841 [Pisolithus orientalis]KAI5994281.1 hypothetical protein F5J12DRAFT_785841 [Pisolithus orientalis]
MPPHQNYQQSKMLSTKQPCKHCSNLYLPQGIKKHKTSSEIAKEAVAATSTSLVHPGITGSLGSAVAVIPAPLRQLSVGPSQSIPGSPTGFALHEDDMLMGMKSPCGRNIPDSAQVVGHSVNSTVLDVQNNHCPEFKTGFHPHSKCPTLFQSAKKFGQQNLKYMAPDCEPWCPFASEGDYIFATVAIEAGLSSTQSGGTTNTTTYQFLKFEIAVPYKGSDMTFPIHICPLWDWALNLLQNPFLEPHFVWDAEQVFKLDSEMYECFYTEPWMGNHWWDIQSWLPMHAENSVPFAFILYADKTQLSSHGTVKGYPMVVICANLPVHICNGEQYSGGCVVGWLPIVPELLTMKNFPFEEFWDLSKTYEMHTTKQHQEALVLYEQKKSASEKKLKSLGLHPIKNIFWLVEHSEPEQAASFEPLHSLHGGLGGKHMHEELKIVVNELGHDFETCLEEW